MADIIIDKYRNETHETTLKVPPLLLRVVTRFLPECALTSLEEKGIELKKITAAQKNEETYCRTIHAKEKNIDKVITLAVR
ncbi:MAG: hypothetical protein WBB19_19610 [Desulforhopalus sp.]